MQCPYCQGETPDGSTRCTRCGSAINAPATTAPAASSYQSNFGDQFNAALIIWKMNLADLAVLTLVFLLVSWIPIANIGFIAGYIRSTLKVARGEGRAEVGDLFNAWDCFGNLLVYLVVLVIAGAILGLVPILGTIAAMALGFLAMPGMYAIIDRKRDLVGAIQWSISTIKANPANWLLSYIVSYVITVVGFILLIIGAIVTLPLGSLILNLQYENNKPD